MSTPYRNGSDLNPVRNDYRISLRIFCGLLGALYAFCILTTYKEISLLWYYMGFVYNPPSTYFTFMTIFAAGVLGLFLPVSDWRLAGYVKWILYFVLFIPALVLPAQRGTIPINDLLLLLSLIWFCAAIFILFLSDGKPFATVRIKYSTLIAGVLAIWFVGHMSLIAVYGENLQLVGIEQVYEQRTANASIGGSAMVYIMGLLSGAINPFILTIGLKEKRWYFVVLAIAGQFIIYSTLAAKVVIGSTILLIGAHFIFRNEKLNYKYIFSAVFVFSVLGPIAAWYRSSSEIVSNISDYVYMRILVLPGVLVGIYSDFFAIYPTTKFSHSLIGRPFTDYPYGMEEIGQVVGRFVTPTASYSVINYNASFLAADGITGFGTWGIPIIFLFLASWLWFASRLIGSVDRSVALAVLTPFVVSLADSSMFTSILTGGGAAAALLLYFYRSAKETRDRGIYFSTSAGSRTRMLQVIR